MRKPSDEPKMAPTLSTLGRRFAGRLVCDHIEVVISYHRPEDPDAPTQFHWAVTQHTFDGRHTTGRASSREAARDQVLYILDNRFPTVLQAAMLASLIRSQPAWPTIPTT